jgi:hypothetical protein
MYTSIVEETPLPLSLFHPRWHLDGPAVLYSPWVMTWDLELETASGPSLANRHVGDRYAARGLQLAEESALAVLEKLKSLPPGMAESFANSFAKGTESLLAQQEKQLVSRKDFPLTLPAPLVEETPLQYRKGKRRAMTGLEVAEERERDASRQRRRDARQAAANEAAEKEIDRREEEKMLEAEWIADTQLQLSQLSYLDADEGLPEPGSQALPLTVSSDSSTSSDTSDGQSDSEPRRSGRVKRSTRAVESQQWQIEHGLIPAPGARTQARALNAKKKKNTKESQLDHEFKLIE